MTKDELIAFLKENLKIKVEIVDIAGGYTREYRYKVHVTLLINDEVISKGETEDHIYISDFYGSNSGY